MNSFDNDPYNKFLELFIINSTDFYLFYLSKMPESV